MAFRSSSEIVDDLRQQASRLSDPALADADRSLIIRRLTALQTELASGGAAALRAALPLLDDPDPQVRRSAAGAVFAVEPERAAQVLTELINDPDGRFSLDAFCTFLVLDIDQALAAVKPAAHPPVDGSYLSKVPYRLLNRMKDD